MITPAQKKHITQADIDPKDQAMPDMLPWCRHQPGIVVLSSGTILATDVSSRLVQNCKIVMQNNGLKVERILHAMPELIQTLIDNALEVKTRTALDSTRAAVSTQQQRLRMLVQESINAEASDIHIEVRKNVARILFRKHGELYLHAEWQPRMGREIASVAFNKETDQSSTHFNSAVPQNASMPLDLHGRDVRLRLASLPTYGGFDMVMRILATDNDGVPTLDVLGYTESQIALIHRAIQLPHGAIIVSGPTGSGKTTTLASCISLVPRERKTYTIEDPVEKIVENVSQVPVNTAQGDRDFASMGRAALRMDPDIIVLGEMRDEDTASVMVRAAITGHLVFSTLHTNTASAIITRLVDMGVSPALLSDPNLLSCLICQRLAPTLCEHCAIPADTSPAHHAALVRWQAILGSDFAKARARGAHCSQCNGTGIGGRTVIAEIIWVDDKSREFIQQNDMLGWEKHLRKYGFTPYRDHAIALVKQGRIDLFDAEKMVGPINTALSAEEFNYRTL